MIPALGPRAVAQIGVLVADLERALERWEAVGPWRVYTYGPETVPELSYRGRPGEFVVRIALNRQTPQLELLQPLAGPSIYEEWLEERGEGLHHLAVRVESLSDAIAAMAAAGYETVQHGAGYGLDGDGGFAYFDTIGELGVTLEAVELPRRRREPELVWPPAAPASS
jgi:hypothetical protein